MGVISFLEDVLNQYTEQDFKDLYMRFLLLEEIPSNTPYDLFFKVLIFEENMINYQFGENEFRDYTITSFANFYVFYNPTFKWNIFFDVKIYLDKAFKEGKTFDEIYDYMIQNFPKYTYSMVMRKCIKKFGRSVINDDNWFYVFPDPWFLPYAISSIHFYFPEPYKTMYENEINDWITQNS